ncbi:MAG: MoaD/ThiS family protein [Dehalococcoidia bacterium]|nr:MoaD/ThiS family protein [Dehalococcoidia bacterium]
MRLRVGHLGILGHHAGCQQLDLALGESATVGDVLREIGARFGDRFPDEVWDRRQGRFASCISAFVDMKDVEDYDAPLGDGSEVLFVTMIAGG